MSVFCVILQQEEITMKKVFYVLMCLLFIMLVFSGCSSTAEEETSYLSMRRIHSGDSGQTQNTSGNSDNSSDNSSTGLIKVGFSQAGSESDWRVAHTNSIRDSLTASNGFELIYENGNGDQNKQIQSIEGFIKEGVDIIVFTPVVEDGWDEVLKKAKDAGIPVIITDRMVSAGEDDLFECWVGSDFIKEGENSINWLVDFMEQNSTKENHKVVILQGTLGASSEKGRTDGIHNILDNLDNYEVVFEETGDFNEIDGEETMKKAINSVDDFDVLIAENDDMAIGAIKALKDNGMNPGSDITVISYDATKRGFQAMVEGSLNVDIECNPLHGPMIAELINDITSGKSVEKIQYVTEGIYPAETAADEIENRVY